MGPLDSRRNDIISLPALSSASHRWKLGEASYSGEPLIVRFNSSAREWIAHEALPIRLGFAVRLKSPPEGGLPTPAENDQLSKIEDVVRREVEARAKGIHVLVLTTGRMREFVFYIAAVADIDSIHDAVRSSVSSHEGQCWAVNDPSWDTSPGSLADEVCRLRHPFGRDLVVGLLVMGARARGSP